MNKEFMNYMREMSEFWSNKYDKYKGEERHVVGRLDAPLEEYTLDTQNIKDCFLTISESGRAVIDFGCGIGRFRDVLSAKYPRYIGVDLVRKMGKDVEFYFLDTFLRKEFKVDAIFTSVVLQHITNDKYLEFLFSRFNACLPVGGCIYMNEQIGDGTIVMRHGFSYINRRKRETYVSLLQKFGFLLDRDIPRKDHRMLKFKKVVQHEII